MIPNLKAIRATGLLLTAFLSWYYADALADDLPAARVYRLDRGGFIQELVFEQATPRTHLFDDYTDGSYHVNKLDLAEGLRQRRTEGTPIIAVAIHGPFGPLWQYNVAIFIRDGEGVRINGLQMPHARIAAKSTKRVSIRQALNLLRRIEESDALSFGDPSMSLARAEGLEWDYDLLLIDWSAGDERMFHTTTPDTLSNDPSPSMLCLREALEELYSGSVWTYSADVSEEESIYRDVSERRDQQ